MDILTSDLKVFLSLFLYKLNFFELFRFFPVLLQIRCLNLFSVQMNAMTA